MKAMLRLTAVACTLAASGAAIGLAPDDGVAREGVGARRAALNEMELKAFPASAWGDLSGWTGEAMTAEKAAGKVVVFVTWKSWYKPSHEALRTAQSIQDKFGGDGVVVVAVHDKEGLDAAAKVMSDKGVSVLGAHDATGAFRAALNVDQDPDFYIVDRAGNLRYADVLTSTVEAAVQGLVKESAEDAANLPKALADKAAAADAASRRSKPVSDSLRPGQILDVPFTMPAADAYASVTWPEQNGGQLYASNVQGQSLPASLGNETWLGEKPSMTGRIVVLDFWATWCGPCKAAMPGLDALQKAHRQDLVIVGMSGQPRGSYKEDVASVKQFLQSHKSAYSHANDMSQTVYKALQVTGIPHVVVMSTDGVVRWQGMPGEPGFKKAVEHLIRVDPGVRARRAAEAKHARSDGN